MVTGLDPYPIVSVSTAFQGHALRATALGSKHGDVPGELLGRSDVMLGIYFLPKPPAAVPAMR